MVMQRDCGIAIFDQFAQKNILHDDRILFQSGLNYLNGCDEVEKQVPQSPERDTLLEFIRTSKRGIIKPYESRCKEE